MERSCIAGASVKFCGHGHAKPFLTRSVVRGVCLWACFVGMWGVSENQGILPKGSNVVPFWVVYFNP